MHAEEIGRASCRERVWMWGDAVIQKIKRGERECREARYEREHPPYCFFFSSRRRHTRLQGDWSSDVCSSDLSPASCGSSETVRPSHRSTLKTVSGVSSRSSASGPVSVSVPTTTRCTPRRSEERRVGKECGCGGTR